MTQGTPYQPPFQEELLQPRKCPESRQKELVLCREGSGHMVLWVC